MWAIDFVLIRPRQTLTQEEWLRTKGYEGFKVKSHRVLLGKGPEVYAKAKTKMVNWELNDAVPWCNFLEGEHGTWVAVEMGGLRVS